MTGLRGVSIGTVLGALIGAMGLLLVCISVISFVAAVGRNAAAERTAVRTQISERLFKEIIPLRNERGAENTSLAAQEPASPATLSDIRTYRQTSEQNYDQAIKLLQTLDAPTLVPLIAQLEATHDFMAGVRPTADAAIRLDDGLRDPVLVRDYMRITQPLLDAIVATTDRLDASMKLTDPIVDQYLSIKRAAWTARLNLGQMVARTQPAVSAAKAFSEADVLAWTADQARAYLAWDLVREAASRPDVPEPIVAAVAAANATFTGPEADARTAVLHTLAEGRKVTTPIVELRRNDTENNGLIVTVAEAALDRMVDRAHHQAAAARLMLAANIVVLVLALALAVIGFLIVQRKVTRPIRAMTHAMRRLAGHDMTVEIPGFGGRDEIGAMADAVLVFKASMLTADCLAAEKAAEQAVKAERAVHLEQVVEELGIQNLRFGAALSNMSQALCMFDPAGGLIVANNRVAEMFGVDGTGMRPGISADMLLAPAVAAGKLQQSDVDQMRIGREAWIAAGAPATRVRELSDGRLIMMNFVPMQGNGWLLTLEDITERTQAEARIAYMARHDALTGLPNRLRFRERLSEAVARGKRGEASAVLFLDLDHFKAVNDTLGHPVGDALLRQVGDRLRAQVRETDMVARLGGDEFAIVQDCPLQPQDATALAKRLIEALSLPYDLSGTQVTIGTSVGIAVLPDDGDDPDQLLKHADMALYGAKADGRDCFRFFEPRMHALMQARRTLEIDLRKALIEDQFEVYYQPLMNIATRNVSGFEALLRWNHPERGLVSPAEFVPLAEEIGLIVPLGKWVLRQACTDAASWPGGVKVAVNVSVIQFGSGTLVDDVTAALALSGLAPRRLDLEITESVMLDDTDGILVILHQLRDLGVGIAMDDFGTGYSSLSYLRRFPFSKVKIDRTFIQGLGTGAGCDAIVTAVTELCQTLGMATVAEGVETEEQLQLLRSGNCGEAQGFLFSKPRPAVEVAAMCRRLNKQSSAADKQALVADLVS